ncbi:MAG: zinc ABC transporter substrate-binding protein [Syntrophorhabdales bacterium]
MRKAAAFASCLLFLASLALNACGRKEAPGGEEKRLTVVTTLFPLYDFARNVGGRKADVSLLLPPGVEPHSFEPKPGNLLRLQKADIFVYTGDFMEPWATVLIEGVQRPDLIVVDSSRGVALRSRLQAEGPLGGGKAPGGGGPGTPIDPHIWLDLANAKIIVENILAAFVKKDPAGRAFYEKNAESYKSRLSELDERFRKGLASCRTRLFVHGGHYAFNYLAARYGLTYISVYGPTPDREPSPRHLAEIVQEMKRRNIKYIFYEELLRPRMAQTIAQETGARLLPLNGGHNVTKEELERGVSFISILERDLDNLKVGLQCR